MWASEGIWAMFSVAFAGAVWGKQDLASRGLVPAPSPVLGARCFAGGAAADPGGRSQGGFEKYPSLWQREERQS